MLSEADRIDIVAKSPKGEIVLGISAHEDWQQNPHTLRQLDEKLKNYIHFIESGQYTNQYGNAPVVIKIMTAHPLSPKAEKLVKRVSKATGINIEADVMGAFNPFK